MGLIKAALGAVVGNARDQWLEFIEAGDMSGGQLIVPGVFVNKGKGIFKTGRGSNTKGSDIVISNGSKIIVGPNQMMIMVENGKVVDFTCEEGSYEVNTALAPSLFSGQFKDSLKDTWERFKYGGVPTNKQQVFFMNLAEITGIKFGTQNPIQYFDAFYNADLSLRAHGMFSVRITDPIKTFMELRSASNFNTSSFGAQYSGEFVMNLGTAIAQMAVDGQRINQIQSKQMELAKYMRNCLDEEWRQRKGIEVESVSIEISYDEESKKLIGMRNQGAMLSDATIREGYVQGAIAQGLQAAGSNTAGAAQAFMGMGMGMNAAGGFMNSASQTNAMQMQMQAQQAQAAAPQQTAAPAAGGWKCSCGKENTGKFCAECGAKKPEDPASWTCSCGAVNTGKFCAECDAKKPEAAESWQCACGAVNTGKFCSECGAQH